MVLVGFHLFKESFGIFQFLVCIHFLREAHGFHGLGWFPWLFMVVYGFRLVSVKLPKSGHHKPFEGPTILSEAMPAMAKLFPNHAEFDNKQKLSSLEFSLTFTCFKTNRLQKNILFQLNSEKTITAGKSIP